MMRRATRRATAALCLGVGLAALALPTGALARHEQRPTGTLFAQPGEIVDIEVRLNRLATAKGEAQAMRTTAVADAEEVRPGAPPVRLVQAFPAHAAVQPAAERSTYAVWMSCDGSVAVSYGGWKREKSSGWYVTVWQRQRKGGYKWVLDQQNGWPAGTEGTPPEMIRAKVGECPSSRAAPRTPDEPPAKAEAAPNYLSGEAKDHTLVWSTGGAVTDSTDTDIRRFSVQIRRNGAFGEVLNITGGTVHVTEL